MANGPTNNDEPSPGVKGEGGESIAGNSEEGLERIRKRLLDLTKRNPLLNYHHPKRSCIRIVNVGLDRVFEDLLGNTSESPTQHKLRFQAVARRPKSKPPEGEEGSGAHQRDVLEDAKNCGWSTSYDLYNAPDNGGALCALQYRDDLDRSIRLMDSKARTIIEESGANMLYLVFGFLEWYESEDSEESHLAPLLMVPVQLERTRGAHLGTIEYTGDQLESNPSLAERLHHDFSLNLPEYEEEKSPETYFAEFEHILRAKPRWKLRRFLTLAFLSFTKILMYRDLDSARWPGGLLAQHPRVRELFEGTGQIEAEFGREYAIDAPEMKGRVPKLILDADSSQHSALVDAVEGRNLVIQGPPGTGKSQTITNLIGHAMSVGKTVLFIAEKLAALEVVRKRLDEAGLGIFCLELHSHRTQKQGLMRDLEERLRLKGNFTEPSEIEAKTNLLLEKKKCLLQYVQLINTPGAALGKTIFEIFWGRERALRELPVAQDLLRPITLPFAATFSAEDVGRTEQFIAIYSKHLRTITAGLKTVEDHLWAWVQNTELGFEGKSRLLHLIRSSRESISDARETISWLLLNPGIEIPQRLDFCSHSGEILHSLPAKESVPDPALLTRCRLPESRQAIRSMVECIENARTHIRKIQCRLSGPFGWDRELVSEISERNRHIEQLGLGGRNLAEIRIALGGLERFLGCIVEACAWPAKLANLLRVPIGETLSALPPAFKCVELIRCARSAHFHLRCEGMTDESARNAIRDACDEASKLQAQRSELSADFNLESVPSPDSLLNHAATLAGTGLLGRAFSRDYKKAKRQYRSITRQRRKRLEMAGDFRRLATHFQHVSAFSNRADLRTQLGNVFKGIDSDWAGLSEIVDWCDGIERFLPPYDTEGASCRRLLYTASPAILMRIGVEAQLTIDELERGSKLVDEIEDWIHQLDFLPHDLVAKPLGEAFHDIKNISDVLRGYLEICAKALLKDEVTPRTAITLLEIGRKVLGTRNTMDENEVAKAALGLTYKGLETDLVLIKETLSLADSVDSGKLPAPTVDWLLCEAYHERLTELKTRLRKLADSPIPNDCNAICTLAATMAKNIWPSLTLDEIAERAAILLGHEEELSEWIHYLGLRKDASMYGISQITQLADTARISAEDILPCFRFVLFNCLSLAVFEKHPELAEFAGLTLSELRKQFASLDRELIRLHRQRFAAHIDSQPVPQGNNSGPVGSWSDLALIHREIDKQRRHIPIRRLVERAGFALQCLKPCFMMGPLSVAQYLTPGKLTFDLVVMDEASQLRPEDAIGAVARAGQLVVVGDLRQLPPTDFFQRLDLEDGEGLSDDDLAVVEEGESILDVAMGVYQPARRLRWHYRSRHESLIAFSNNEFYQGDLIVFPTPFPKREDLGVRYHEIAHPVYENRRNIPEAQAVVDAAIDHMHRHADESLGVVTLNLQQKEVIEELFEKAVAEDPQAQAYQEKFGTGLEGFFIKNLENVQGDERDVIVISCTYGPDMRGNQYQRFGPINSRNGHRRLNVLFTRAKKRVEVFNSLDPGKILIQSGSHRGVRALKDYLEYARTGILEGSNPKGREPDSDFEISVAGVLADNGYEVRPQVGVAGFFIDLAVVHPYEPGAFITGIECDGAAYHSAKSARDRDRLRQEILQNLGWKIYRVWSTDWFGGRERETRRLISYLESLVDQDPRVKARRAEQERTSALKNRLIKFREDEIWKAYPNSNPSRCLLRDQMINEFTTCRPTTRDQWFRRIPQSLRSETESEQVGRFLDIVLDIISDHSDGS